MTPQRCESPCFHRSLCHIQIAKPIYLGISPHKFIDRHFHTRVILVHSFVAQEAFEHQAQILRNAGLIMMPFFLYHLFVRSMKWVVTENLNKNRKCKTMIYYYVQPPQQNL